MNIAWWHKVFGTHNLARPERWHRGRPRPAERHRHRARHGTAPRHGGTGSSDGHQLMTAGAYACPAAIASQLWLGWCRPASAHGRTRAGPSSRRRVLPRSGRRPILVAGAWLRLDETGRRRLRAAVSPHRTSEPRPDFFELWRSSWSPVTESNRRPSPYHAFQFHLMTSQRVALPHVGGIVVSEYVARRLPLPGVVVTWFVTASRTSSKSKSRIAGPAKTQGRHDHGAMMASPSDNGIGERALPLPVKVRPSRTVSA